MRRMVSSLQDERPWSRLLLFSLLCRCFLQRIETTCWLVRPKRFCRNDRFFSNLWCWVIKDTVAFTLISLGPLALEKASRNVTRTLKQPYGVIHLVGNWGLWPRVNTDSWATCISHVGTGSSRHSLTFSWSQPWPTSHPTATSWQTMDQNHPAKASEFLTNIKFVRSYMFIIVISC